MRHEDLGAVPMKHGAERKPSPAQRTASGRESATAVCGKRNGANREWRRSAREKELLVQRTIPGASPVNRGPIGAAYKSRGGGWAQ